ncbi:hypothetical protein R1flu_016762 [Riccia fluitans]|uniref:Uncharacterized protein n=1 Tax=Riccia fluitans TaxID=41844 RepID=A0ABD1YNA2_9MARC
MTPRGSKSLKTKEVKIPHLTVSNRKKMESWGLGGLFSVDWSGTYDNLVEELVAKKKAAGSKFEYRGKPEERTSEVWREVYNLPKASPGGYVMKGKIQFTELQLLKVVKDERRQRKSRVFLEQIKGNSDFVLFCQILNSIFALVRPEHFQHNLLAFFHHAWAAITNPDEPTPDWGEAVQKTVARQIKSLGVCNEATCLGPYLAHLYSHFHEMDAVEKEASKKRKATIQTISDSDTKTEPEEEKEPPKEVPRAFCEGEASGSKPLDLKTDFAEWGNRVLSFIHETGRLLEAFHVEFGSETAEGVARTKSPVVETDLQPWKEMVRTLANLLTEEQKKMKLVAEQRDYFEGKNHRSEKIPKIAMWCTQQLQSTRDAEAPLLATVEELKKALEEHGIPIPPEVGADEVKSVKNRLRGEEDRLAMMLGQKAPSEGVQMEDSHVSKMLELARIMLGRE